MSHLDLKDGALAHDGGNVGQFEGDILSKKCTTGTILLDDDSCILEDTSAPFHHDRHACRISKNQYASAQIVPIEHILHHNHVRLQRIVTFSFFCRLSSPPPPLLTLGPSSSFRGPVAPSRTPPPEISPLSSCASTSPKTPRLAASSLSDASRAEISSRRPFERMFYHINVCARQGI